MRSRLGWKFGAREFGLVVAWSALALGGCASELGCDLNDSTRDLGGAGLMDCGLAEYGDTDTVDTCAVREHGARGTFRAIYERKDGSLEAVVHAAGDRYYLFRADADGDHVKRAECESASVVTDGDREFVECDSHGEFRAVCD
jgi:hypothetical protein